MQLDKKSKKISSLVKIYTLCYKQFLIEKDHLLKLINDMEVQIIELERNLLQEQKKYAKNINMHTVLNNYGIHILNKKNELYNFILDTKLKISMVEKQALNAYHIKSACQSLLNKVVQEKIELDKKLEIKEIEQLITQHTCVNNS